MATSSLIDGLGGYAPYILLVCIVIVLLRMVSSSRTDPREPLSLKPSIPIIGHIIGVFRYKMTYFEMISAKTDMPICSIQMGPSKVIVALSPDVVQSALRNRSLSFDPFSVAFAKRVVRATSKKFIETSYTPKNDKEVCYNNDMHKVYHEPMQPGPDLQQTNAAMLHEVSKFMNEIGPEYEQKELYTWIRDSFTIATSIALFGSRNPFPSDPSLNDALWDFEAGVQMLMLDFFPYFTAHKADLGRDKVQKAMRAYFEAGYDRDDDVSPFIKRRSVVQRKYGFGPSDMGDFDLAMMMVATTNAIPTLVWTIIYILSSPRITAAIRAEVTAITHSSDSNSTSNSTDPQAQAKTRTMTIDASKFASHCPVLAASYQESIRLSNRQMSIRIAEQDTTVSSSSPPSAAASGPPSATYLVKKGSVILLPSNIYTESPLIWGRNAHTFEPERWIKGDASSSSSASVAAATPAPAPVPVGKESGNGKEGGGEIDAAAAAAETEASSRKEAERLQKRAFFPFGGGRHLCPGRHFAFAEILGMVALLVMGFDIEEVGGAGGAAEKDEGQAALRIPERHYRFFGEAVPKPVGAYEVLIRRKKGFEGVRWEFDLGV